MQTKSYGSVQAPEWNAEKGGWDVEKGGDQQQQESRKHMKLEDDLDADVRKGFQKKVFTHLQIGLGITFLYITVCMVLSKLADGEFGDYVKQNSQFGTMDQYYQKVKEHYGYSMYQDYVWTTDGTYQKIFRVLTITGQVAGLAALILQILCFGFYCIPGCIKVTGFIYYLNVALSSLLVGQIALSYQPQSVFVISGMTVVVSLFLMIYQAKTKTDYTKCNCCLWLIVLLVLPIGLCLFGLIVFFQFGPTYYCVFMNLSCVLINLFIVVLLCFFIVFITQLIIGGKGRQQEFSVDDHWFQQMLIYYYIIELLIKLLELFGRRN